MIPSNLSFTAFHGLSLLTWGPSLAFCFPNLPETKFEMVMFWLQHVLLGALPRKMIQETGDVNHMHTLTTSTPLHTNNQWRHPCSP